ncbi:hypothetical protein CVT24_010053 [Panaeolus cyanescens]|uniref:Uncharacterized protein n=1 Tax=Panaeolus cyanescens TaxID=181874 RepID=A0A409YW79_9AGAR|nr:hypothetical protein CVT24_010053 [Panaeolus cyanescens]
MRATTSPGASVSLRFNGMCCIYIPSALRATHPHTQTISPKGTYVAVYGTVKDGLPAASEYAVDNAFVRTFVSTPAPTRWQVKYDVKFYEQGGLSQSEEHYILVTNIGDDEHQGEFFFDYFEVQGEDRIVVPPPAPSGPQSTPQSSASSPGPGSSPSPSSASATTTDSSINTSAITSPSLSSSTTSPSVNGGSGSPGAPGSNPDPNTSDTDPPSIIGSPSRSSVPVGVIVGPLRRAGTETPFSSSASIDSSTPLQSFRILDPTVTPFSRRHFSQASTTTSFIHSPLRRAETKTPFSSSTSITSSTPLQPFRIHNHDHDSGPIAIPSDDHPLAIVTRHVHRSNTDLEVETTILSQSDNTNPSDSATPSTASPLIARTTREMAMDHDYRPEKSPQSPQFSDSPSLQLATGPHSPIQHLWTPSLPSTNINTPTSPNLLARVRRTYASSISWDTSASASDSNLNDGAREDSDVLPRYESMIMSRRTDHAQLKTASSYAIDNAFVRTFISSPSPSEIQVQYNVKFYEQGGLRQPEEHYISVTNVGDDEHQGDLILDYFEVQGEDRIVGPPPAPPGPQSPPQSPSVSLPGPSRSPSSTGSISTSATTTNSINASPSNSLCSSPRHANGIDIFKLWFSFSAKY